MPNAVSSSPLRGLERDEPPADGHQDARRNRSVAGPVRETAAGWCTAGSCGRWQHFASTTAASPSAWRARGETTARRSSPARGRRTTCGWWWRWLAVLRRKFGSCGRTASASSEPPRSPSAWCRGRAVPPDQRSRVGVERDDARWRRRVHHPADDDRRLLRADALERPRLREPRDVGRVDLRELRELRPREVAGKARPVGVGERRDAVLPGDEVSADGHQHDGQNDWEKRASHARRLQHNLVASSAHFCHAIEVAGPLEQDARRAVGKREEARVWPLVSRKALQRHRPVVAVDDASRGTHPVSSSPAARSSPAIAH